MRSSNKIHFGVVALIPVLFLALSCSKISTTLVSSGGSPGGSTGNSTGGVHESVTPGTVRLPVIPYSDPDFIAPGRGAYYWLGTEGALAVETPVAGQAPAPLDHYSRFKWGQIESDTGTFDFTRFDAEFKAAIIAGRKFAFGIMTICPPTNCGGLSTVGGFALSYPLYLHNQMQAEAIPDWGAANTAEGSFWVPNWNSPSFLAAWARMLNAIAAHIETTSYNGVKFKEVISWVDVHGVGLWGEWHNYAWGSVPNPAGTAVTASSLISMIDAHKTAFPNFPLVGYLGMFAAKEINQKNTAYIVPAEVSCYAAQVTNAYGEMGWRRDNWGTNATWLSDYVENNPIICSNGKALKDLIMNKWKKALITGEPNGSATTAASGGDCSFYDLEREVRLYHASSVGNGNWGGSQTQACMQNYVRAAMKASGYRIQINGGNYTSTVDSSRALKIELGWRNTGIAPTYENWVVTFELRSASGAKVWSGNSSMVLKLFLPDSADLLLSDSFTLPSSVLPGAYSLVAVIKDPIGYRKPLPLANTGRTADGAYPLGEVTVK